MSGYLPIDRDILTSSLWAKGSPSQIKVFIYLLLRADPRTGVVPDSDPAIALHCGLGEDVTDEALEWLASPDPKSRSEEEKGARIKREDGRWVIVNYSKYRAKDYSTGRVQRWREKKRNAALPALQETEGNGTERSCNEEQEQGQEQQLYDERESVLNATLRPTVAETDILYREPERALSIWMVVAERLRDLIAPHSYATWVRPTKPLGFTDNPEINDEVLVVAVPTEEHRAHIWGNYKALIARASFDAGPCVVWLKVMPEVFR